MKEVGVLSVTYNRLQLLQEEIESIRKQTYKKFDIIVVNNYSTDGTKEWLNQQDDIHSIHVEPANIGPARAFALGMKYIAEHGYKYCWLMDDDVECYPDALANLYKAYHTKDNIGFVCSNVIGTDGCPMNVPKVDTRLSSNGYSDYAKYLDKSMIKVIRCTFVSMFLSCNSMYEIGMPYGEFYNWAVDTEYSLRLSLNHDSYLVGNSIVIHKRVIQGEILFETEKDPVRLSYYRSNYRNLIFVKFKYDTKSKYEKINYLLKYLIEIMKLLIRCQFSHFLIKFQALMDFLKFNPKVVFPKLNK